MLKQLMCFLGKKWLVGRSTNKKRGLGHIPYESLIIENDEVSFGYLRYGESVHDLQ
jgi:hypothetical protein